ncbi:aminotransferase class V-fold PLP-dependent enzyme [Rubripirellula reticaptiva]|uniref:Isopenicillin N epimerase n=1 Tax=Rubripirellula reticaptiva TaxID=2528013 RepID=A0A5C6EJH6_9BACT|nr:aminotransferase class V-fold PLP-dependent enzyme [Rubripirellula reticaptiva]TWU47816.1 Isopenicillin N epimerase [Rubripirellula reticaptiva]
MTQSIFRRPTAWRSHWQLDPNLDFLNHGSFGATPTVVLEEQRRIRDQLERDPIEFLAPERSLLPRLDAVRAQVARLVGADEADIAWVRNATDGVNAVVRSFPFRSGDNVVVTNHGYNACTNAIRYVADRSGVEVRVVEVPFPISGPTEVVDAIDQVIDSSTRLLLVDHVTSPTGLVFPVKDIVDLAHCRGARVLIDGAHAPGMVPVDLREIDADYYTANHHKWLCGPKVSGFLWTRPEWQSEVRPTVISHAANRPVDGRSRYTSEFDWTGTFDPSPLLATAAAINFLDSLLPGGIVSLMQSNRELAIESRGVLCEALHVDAPAPDSMIGSLIALPIQSSDEKLQQVFRTKHRFEFPIYPSLKSGTQLMRIALQAYNDLDQVQRLAGLLRSMGIVGVR